MPRLAVPSAKRRAIAATKPEMKDGAFILKGKATVLNSGELHYFRIDPSYWDERLDQARRAGLNTISTYIPWRWHEAREGKFDFSGHTHPRRDLITFLRKVREHGLYFIARVGPVSNGEMMGEGLPDWLLRDYPETFLPKSGTATIHHQSPPAYNNPLFLEKVARWYERLLPLLTSEQYPSGPIVLFQLCNEIGMINWLGKIGDYADYSERAYRDFLKARHGTVARLNAAYGTKYKSFAEMRQPKNLLVEGNLKSLLDWGDYYKEYYAAYFAKIYALARRLGVRTPVLANIPQFYDFDMRGRGIYSPATTAMFSRFREKIPTVVFGGAYQMRRLDYENFHDIPLTSAVVRSITPKGSTVLCAELQTGVLSDRPRLYPADVELNLKTSLMSGLDGLNGYMFAGGTNEDGLGQFGRYHEWQAPVAADGRLRPQYESLIRFGRFVNGLGSRVAGMANVVDVALGHYEPYYNTLYLEGRRADEMYNHRNEYYFDGLARLCYTAGYQTGVADLLQDELAGLPALAVYSRRFMDAKTQQRLLDYVKGGGRLLFCGDVLLEDENGRTCTEFLDGLDLKAGRVEHVRTLELFGLEAFVANQDASVFEGLKASDKVIARINGRPSGFVRHVGKGAVCVLGFPVHDKFDYFKSSVDEALRELGVSKTVDCGTYDLVAQIRRSKDSGFLYLGNFHDDTVSGSVMATFNGKKIVFPIRMERRSALVTPLSLDVGQGVRLLWSTAEIFSVQSLNNGLMLEWTSATERQDLVTLSGASFSSVRVERGSAVLRPGVEGTVLEVEHGPGETWNRAWIQFEGRTHVRS